MLSLKEFKKGIAVIKELHEKRDKIDKIFSSIMDGYPIFTLFDKAEDVHLEFLKELMGGDESDWISWFVYENDFGKSKFTISYDGNTHIIDTVEKLYNHCFKK